MGMVNRRRTMSDLEAFCLRCDRHFTGPDEGCPLCDKDNPEITTAGNSFCSPIHNGIKRQWNYLEVVDRASGEVERIRLDDANSSASVAHAAERNEMTSALAWEILLDGGQIATAGFVRRLAL
jgi:hypothetical protein